MTPVTMCRYLLGLMLALIFASAAQAADLSGEWSADGKTIFTFDRHGDAFTGSILYEGKVFKIVDGTLDGDAISFFVLHDAADDPEVTANNGKPFRNTAKGTVSGDEMSLSGSRETSNERAYSMTLKRMAP